MYIDMCLVKRKTMPRGYTKEDVINAGLMRFIKAGLDTSSLEVMFNNHYDKVGKEKFRDNTSVTPDVMKEYFEWMKQ